MNFLSREFSSKWSLLRRRTDIDSSISVIKEMLWRKLIIINISIIAPSWTQRFDSTCIFLVHLSRSISPLVRLNSRVRNGPVGTLPATRTCRWHTVFHFHCHSYRSRTTMVNTFHFHEISERHYHPSGEKANVIGGSRHIFVGFEGKKQFDTWSSVRLLHCEKFLKVQTTI